MTEILSNKGSDVATVAPDDTVGRAVEVLRERGIGAVVVTGDGRSIDGILSERDVVRALADADEDAVLCRPVSEIMTAEVVTCSPSDRVERLMSMMTGRRIRHLPVKADGALAGIISIGDVVKSRLSELENAAKALEDYLHHGR